MKRCAGLAALAVAVLAGCGGGRAAPAPELLVLVTIDTLRADHLPFYGYRRDTTPFLASLAERGRVFEQAMAAAPLTAPSHATLLTGRYPFEHGIVVNGPALPPDFPTVAGALAEQGWETAAFLGVGFLGRVASGFGHVDAESRNAGGTIDAALAWLGARRDARPAFVWVHLYDVHEWYRGAPHMPEALIDATRALASGPGFDAYLAELHGWDRAEPVAGARELERLGRRERVALVDHYDARIRFVDRHLRRLYDVVASGGRRHAWVVTADHGEGVWSHGLLAHAEHVYEAQLRVPLLIFRSWQPRAERLDAPVHGIDLFPTLLELAGEAPRAPRAEAASLLAAPSRLERAAAERTLLGQRSPFGYIARKPPSTAWEPDEVFALRRGRFKLIEHTRGDPEVYDLEADPHESRDLGRLDPWPFGDAAEHFRAALGDSTAHEVEIPEEVAEELRALGYAR